jgi:hypothetical protein
MPAEQLHGSQEREKMGDAPEHSWRSYALEIFVQVRMRPS